MLTNSISQHNLAKMQVTYWECFAFIKNVVKTFKKVYKPETDFGK